MTLNFLIYVVLYFLRWACTGTTLHPIYSSSQYIIVAMENGKEPNGRHLGMFVMHRGDGGYCVASHEGYDELHSPRLHPAMHNTCPSLR